MCVLIFCTTFVLNICHSKNNLTRHPKCLSVLTCTARYSCQVLMKLEVSRHISEIQPNLGSRTPRIMNNSVYEQIFRTQSVSDDVLSLELRTRKPSTSWEKIQKKIKRIPFQTITFHFLTTFHLRRQLPSMQVR